MYRDIAQWTMVRRKVLEEGVSRRQIARETGINRGTIRKMLLHTLPPPFSARSPQYPKLGQHIETIDRLVAANRSAATEPRSSVAAISRALKHDEGFAGSYSAVKGYVGKHFGPGRNPGVGVWDDIYEMILLLKKPDAIRFMRTLSTAKAPLLSPFRVQKFFREAVELMETQAQVNARKSNITTGIDWIGQVLRKELPTELLREEFGDIPDFQVLIEHLHEGQSKHRHRAMAVLAHFHGVSDRTIASALKINRHTVRAARTTYKSEGADALFSTKRRSNAKTDDSDLKATIFRILHEPPSDHGINRTSWTMAHLREVLAKEGAPACAEVVRSIIKAAGYRWRKARVVLTSNDPEYAEKLARIRSILSGLGADEAFFSIDEFGPFAVKAKAGRVLAVPGEMPQVAQWQKSKGCLILTAALELSGNQVTHFYSLKKNTTEMIRMMNLLLDRYRDQRKLYLSWDAASWHVSKKLFERIEENNAAAIETGGPLVETAPLPARAQFLNVIESIFSGMARAIIHNSDYGSVDEAKAAIDRYFEERNRHFREHPRRAGNRIWGKERVPPEFAEGNNCKDPRYR